MLSFNKELNKMIKSVKEEYEQQPFIPIEYPATIDKDNDIWKIHEDSIFIPKVKGNLYFIFDEDKSLLYIGKTKDITFSLFNHLKRRTSKSMMSILDDIKEKVSESDSKRIYLKVVDVEPIELSNTIKPYLVKEYAPSLVKRLS